MFNGGFKFGNSVDVKVTCGLGSNTIIPPDIKDNTEGMSTYLMFVPEHTYTIESFKASTLACPIETIDITAVTNGDESDYTSSDSSTLVSITSADPSLIFDPIENGVFSGLI